MKIVGLILCLFIIHRGLAIKCYNCQSSATNDCTNTKSIPIVTCTPTRETFPPVCIRRVLTSEYGKNVTLQCIEKQNGNECDPPSPTYKVERCQMCQHDLCNGSQNYFVSLLLVPLFPLLLLQSLTG